MKDDAKGKNEDDSRNNDIPRLSENFQRHGNTPLAVAACLS